jgi:hypothetical protein
MGRDATRGMSRSGVCRAQCLTHAVCSWSEERNQQTWRRCRGNAPCGHSSPRTHQFGPTTQRALAFDWLAWHRGCQFELRRTKTWRSAVLKDKKHDKDAHRIESSGVKSDVSCSACAGLLMARGVGLTGNPDRSRRFFLRLRRQDCSLTSRESEEVHDQRHAGTQSDLMTEYLHPPKTMSMHKILTLHVSG